MSKYYKIWDRKTPIITPIMEVLTPAQWIERYPAAAIETIVPVVAAGEINGGFFGTLGEMVRRAEAEGCDFSACTTDEEKLEAIEAFQDAKAAASAAAAKERAEAEAAALAAEAEAMEKQAAAVQAIADGQKTENAEALDLLLNGEE